MDYKDRIEYALEHIEANLKTELTLACLAKAAGYSEYHFLRIFKQVTGLTPADYIRKRRISEIVRETDGTNRAISDIAFEYGFNSKENFTRAFKSEHNILPTEYKLFKNSLKLFNKLQLIVSPFEIIPEIVTIDGFCLTVCINNEDYIPKFWNLYNCKKMSLKLSGGKTVPDYGVSYWNSEKKQLDYFIGIRTSDATGDTAGTIQLEIPGGLYAVFTTPPATHFDFINTVHRTWAFINNIWILNGKYRHSLNRMYEFETYLETSRTFSEKIFIPITEKE